MSLSSPLFTKADSSDYITAKRQMVIASEYLNTNNTNPVKKNGKTYNKNFKFVPTKTLDLSNCLIESKSYELLQSYTTGKGYIDQKCSSTTQ
jgi:hypothetical protein